MGTLSLPVAENLENLRFVVGQIRLQNARQSLQITLQWRRALIKNNHPPSMLRSSFYTTILSAHYS